MGNSETAGPLLPSKWEPTITKVSADERGEMYSISLPGDRELMLLHSFKGTLRGGHSHSCPEALLLLSGRMRYTKKSLLSGRERQEELAEGDWSYNYAGLVHMGEFLEDSWLIEYKIGVTKEGWTQANYAPYRDKVLAQLR